MPGQGRSDFTIDFFVTETTLIHVCICEWGVRVRAGPARSNTSGRGWGFSVQFKDKPTQMDTSQGFTYIDRCWSDCPGQLYVLKDFKVHI